MEVRKYGARVQISRDEAIDHGLVQPTEAERRKREEWAVEYEHRKQAATDAVRAFLAALAAVADPVGRAVLDLHRATDWGECDGCEFGGYEAERPDWPCSTTTTIATLLGIPVPPDLDMVDRALFDTRPKVDT